MRPVQLSLIEGGDKAIGPLVQSVIVGNNSDLIAAVAPLYLTGSVLDVTYGRGMWWRRWRPEHLVAHDVAVDGVDFRALPYPEDAFDAVCFDPPYVPRHGQDRGIPQRHKDFRARFGLVESRSQIELDALIFDGLAECARGARKWLLVKCCDYVNGRRFHLMHVKILAEAERLGWSCHDLLVLASGPGPGGGQIHQPRRARRAHSYLLVLSPI